MGAHVNTSSPSMLSAKSDSHLKSPVCRILPKGPSSRNMRDPCKVETYPETMYRLGWNDHMAKAWNFRLAVGYLEISLRTRQWLALYAVTCTGTAPWGEASLSKVVLSS